MSRNGDGRDTSMTLKAPPSLKRGTDYDILKQWFKEKTCKQKSVPDGWLDQTMGFSKEATDYLKVIDYRAAVSFYKQRLVTNGDGASAPTSAKKRKKSTGNSTGGGSESESVDSEEEQKPKKQRRERNDHPRNQIKAMVKKFLARNPEKPKGGPKQDAVYAKWTGA
jgi:hypothetical protein